MAVSNRTFERFYPRSSRSGTVLFYSALRREMVPGCKVLNLGAGPGDLPDSEIYAIRDLRGPGQFVSGCDPDDAVLANPQVDEAEVMGSDGRIPYDDSAFDLVYSDYVLEHIGVPEAFLAEVFRVLKPGRPFYFRTPNLYHYVSIAAKLMPHGVHSWVANRARNLEDGAHEPYPTFHRMNTVRTLRNLSKKAGFSQIDLILYEGEPSYLKFNSIAFLAGVAYERTVNGMGWLKGFRANIFGKMTK